MNAALTLVAPSARPKAARPKTGRAKAPRKGKLVWSGSGRRMTTSTLQMALPGMGQVLG